MKMFERSAVRGTADFPRWERRRARKRPAPRAWMTSPIVPVSPGPICLRRRARRVRIALSLAMLASLVVVATAGCVPATVMAGLNLVGGATQSLAVSGNKAPYAGRGATAQNGRTDPSIGEALRVSDQEIADECRKALDRPGDAAAGTVTAAAENEAPVVGPAVDCALEKVCLPGFRAPVTLRLCRRGGGTAGDRSSYM